MAGHFTDDRPAVESNLFCPPCVFRPIRSWNMLGDIPRGKVERNCGEAAKMRIVIVVEILLPSEVFDIFTWKLELNVFFRKDFPDKSDFEINLRK